MPKRKLHKYGLLKHLRSDARKTLAEIARQEGLAVSTIFEHIKRLESDVITRYTCLIDHSKLGFPFRCVLYCDNTIANEVGLLLKNLLGVNSLYATRDGGLCADVFFRSLSEEESLREQLLMFNEQAWGMHRVIEPVIEESWLP